MIEALDAETRAAFHEAYVAYCESHRDGGVVRGRRAYLLVVGRRR